MAVVDSHRVHKEIDCVCASMASAVFTLALGTWATGEGFYNYCIYVMGQGWGTIEVWGEHL